MVWTSGPIYDLVITGVSLYPTYNGSLLYCPCFSPDIPVYVSLQSLCDVQFFLNCQVNLQLFYIITEYSAIRSKSKSINTMTIVQFLSKL